MNRPDDLPSSNHYPSTDRALLSKEYQWLWEQVKAEGKKLASAKKAAQVAIDNRTRYEAVAKETKAPWFFIAVIHYREASQSWNGCLHNGDPWNKVTKHVPAGRGPWKSWEDAAVDALQFEGYANLHDWTLGDVFRRLEGYNGFGYRVGGVKNFTCHKQGNRAGTFDGIYHGSMQDTTPRNSSPYVYNGTPFYEKGISIEDHSFYPDAVDDNVGVMFFLKVLEGLSGGPLFLSSGSLSATASTHALAAPSAAVPPITSATPETEVLTILKALAASVDVPAASIDRMFDLQIAARPGRIPRFWAACDFRKRSDRPRFHIFDRVANTVTSHLCAHGQGSEDKDHDERRYRSPMCRARTSRHSGSIGAPKHTLVSMERACASTAWSLATPTPGSGISSSTALLTSQLFLPRKTEGLVAATGASCFRKMRHPLSSSSSKADLSSLRSTKPCWFGPKKYPLGVGTRFVQNPAPPLSTKDSYG